MNARIFRACHQLATLMTVGALALGCSADKKAAAAADAATAADTAVADTGTTADTATSGDTAAKPDTATGDTGPADTAPMDTATGDTAAAAPTCEAYCKAVTANCKDANAQYKDEAECLGYCKTQGKLPVGTADDKSGNTIGCRSYHAGAAAGDPATHCSHAGKTGGNVCGTWCDNYCHLVDKSCLMTKNDMDTDAAGCAAKCATLKSDGKPNDAAGDTVQCRIYHLGVAGTDEANSKIHCPHGKVAPAAGTPCAPAGPTCEAYCKAVTANCKDANAQYKDEAECNTYCKTQGKLPAGTSDDKSGNTIGCRTYHAGAAAGDPATHCSHAGKTGANVCGTWCDNYCQLATSNCTATLAIFADKAECATKCATAAATGKPGDAAGDTLQCRIYHLGVAGTDEANAKIHCPHGKIPAPDGTPCAAAATTGKTVKVAAPGDKFEFAPAATMISVGDSVEFTLASIHNVVEVSKADYDAGKVNAMAGGPIGTIDFGKVKTIKFDKAGTFYFFCSPHAPSMKGIVTVM